MLYKDFLKDLHTCPFCSGKDRMLLESETTYLTYALAPYHPHHLLVIPKRHMLLFSDLTQNERGDIDVLVHSGFEALKHLGYENLTVLVREGNGSGKSIPHLHYHLIPNIRIGDIDHQGNERAVLSPEEVARTVADIEGVLHT